MSSTDKPTQALLLTLLLVLASAVTACNADDGSSPDTSVRAGSSGASGTGGAGVSQAGSTPTTPQGGRENTAGSSHVAGGSGLAGSGSVAPIGKLEPAAGKTLLVIGQDTASIEEYAEQVGPMPQGVMLYSNIRDLAGLSYPTDFGAGQNNLQHWQTRAPGVALQIGLNLVDSLDGLGQGQMDLNVDTLGELLRDCGHPVFLRVGYEFDSAWAGYEPNAFQKAYRRIVDGVRAKGADNVAFVWHSWGFQHSFGQASVATWYPGDSYVDWVGVSLFPGWDAVSTQAAIGARSEIAAFAKQHQKPFMIAEAGPRQAFEPSRGADAWSGWYQGVFDFIAQHDVKMFSYINANWDAQPLWAGQGWGDTRVQTNAYVLERWRAELAKPRFAIAR